MGIKEVWSQRWQRLRQRAADIVQADAAPTPAADSPPVGDAEDAVPDAQHWQAISSSLIAHWRAFFTRFRSDEAPFEQPQYEAAGATLEARLAQRGGRPLDAESARMLIDLLTSFEQARFRDVSERLDDLIVSSQALRAQWDAAQLGSCFQQDEYANCHLLLIQAVRTLDPSSDEARLHAERVPALLRRLLALHAPSSHPPSTAAAPATAPAPPAVPPAPPAPPAQPAPPTSPDGVAATTVAAAPPPAAGSGSLHEAALRGRSDQIDLLVARGADVNAAGSDGLSALHLAASKGQIAVLHRLFAHGATLTARDQEGRTAMHLAADQSSVEAIRTLAALGAPVNVADGRGWTPLHLAANRGKEETVALLLALGAAPGTTAANGWTARTVAINSGHLAVATLLRGGEAAAD